MRARDWSRFLLSAVLLSATLACEWTYAATDDEASASGELAAYVTRPDTSTAWREVAAGRVGTADYVEYLLTSQTWRGIQWKHQLFLLRPANMKQDVRQGFLFIHGGRWRAEYEGERKQAALPREALLFVRLAETIGAPVAVLRQVPFAPLFERTEDALIAYTFDQYLQTGESDWPLLLPMVKSSVRALDATQSIVRERWGATLESFTVSGASKRGWTAWLTSAIDKRVAAVAPMVIDVLNMRAQLDHQRATWGELSDEIRDYSAIDLPARLASDRGRKLLAAVDPFSYRRELTRPKLILLSTNDRYWPLDALDLYWSELPAPKHVLYVPNQAHDLNDIDRVIGALSALHRYTARGATLPQTTWSFGSDAKTLRIAIEAARAPQRVTIWSATSRTRDFRDAHWASRPCTQAGDRYACEVARSAQEYTAVFAETAFEDQGAPVFSTTTTVCIAAPPGGEQAGC
jgi:PhoPQ-activated pathogenicity-related protein